MKVLIFGASGMIGQGVLRECLLHPDVTAVLTIARSPAGESHAKLREIVHGDFTDFSPLEPDLSGLDACFFCLGISSVGMNEADYRRVTFDVAMSAARALVARSPGMTFVFVSGSGADSSEKGTVMWARIKGMTENAVLRFPFKAAYVFRPGFVQPRHGITSKTNWYRVFYALTGPIYPLVNALAPQYITTTDQIGLAMIHIVRRGYAKRVLENRDINALAEERSNGA